MVQPANQSPEPIKFLDLVDYQTGAVVSRQVLKKSAGSVTLFAFDEGQGLSEHSTPYDALVNVLDGEMEITIAGKPLTVKTGEMLIMPVGQAHALKAITKSKLVLVMIRT